MKIKLIIISMLISLSVFSQSELTTQLFGGSNNEYSYEHCFDDDGNFIVVGVVRGSDMYFTDTIGTVDNTNKNIYIRKYSNDLSTLIASTLICGSGHDYCKSVDIDSQGNIFIGGFTLSSDVPVSANAYQQINNSVGNYEGYIIKLNSNIDTLIAATYIGGEEEDKLYKLRIDENDHVIVVGNTLSTTNIATIGAYDETYNGTTGSLFDFGDAYIIKFDNNLENKLAGTYLGGTGDEACYSAIINSSNNIVITGQSTSTDYPTSVNAFQTTNNGGFDIIVTEFNSDLTQIVISTFVGANDTDTGWDITYDYVNNRYIIGAQTYSTNFNITGNVADPTVNGNGDGMLVILDGNLETVHSATFVGGSNLDLITSVYFSNNAIIYGGITESNNLPTSSDAYYPNYLEENSLADVFVGSIDNNLSQFNYLSYFGGNDDDHIWKVSVYDDKIYFNGVTYSTNVESDSTFQGASDGMISILENIYLDIEKNKISENNNEISVYPNPASEIINISSTDIINKLDIIDITGRVLLSSETPVAKHSINISNLHKGVYFVKLENSVIKFVKE